MATVHINRGNLARLFDGSTPGTPGAALKQAAERIAEEARVEAPSDTGTLRSSIHVNEVSRGTTHLSLEVIADAPYAAAVHSGTGPAAGRPPYLPKFGKGSRLHIWSVRHGLPAGGVAHTIQARGTEPRPFLMTAFRKAWPFGR